MTNKCTIISQIITLLLVSTQSCYPYRGCNQYLTKLHKYFKYSCCFTNSCIHLRMGNVSNKSCRENHNTNFIFNNIFPENLDIYEIRWKNIVRPGRPQKTIRHMRIACCIPKATNTHRICNTYCFSTATMVARTCLIVKLYLHCCYICLGSK